MTPVVGQTVVLLRPLWYGRRAVVEAVADDGRRAMVRLSSTLAVSVEVGNLCADDADAPPEMSFTHLKQRKPRHVQRWE